MSEYLLLLVSTVLVNNFVLVKFLGLCPFMGVSKKIEPAIGMGVATAFVLTLTSAFCYLVNQYILTPLGAASLSTLALIRQLERVVQLHYWTHLVMRLLRQFVSTEQHLLTLS